MNLSKLNTRIAAEKGEDLHLRHPTTGEKLYTEDGQPITIRMAGTDSSIYRNAIKDMVRQRKGVKTTTPEQGEAFALDLLTSITLDWKNIVLSDDGEPLQFSPENARNLYAEYTWIREQADEFAGDRANFLPKA
ncbi:hypothetical protein VPH49_24240 [Pseudomonas luteola]|uniref:hypothetical protein n=1 Tax=Pseudomonas luteola TaxID=47886 RepID=UPI003A8611B0